MVTLLLQGRNGESHNQKKHEIARFHKTINLNQILELWLND